MGVREENRARIRELITAGKTYDQIHAETGACDATIARVKADMGLISENTADAVALNEARREEKRAADLVAETAVGRPEQAVARKVLDKANTETARRTHWNAHWCEKLPSNVRIINGPNGPEAYVGKVKWPTLEHCPACGEKLS